METWSCTVSLQACINWWGYINWSNTAFPLELLFLCSLGRDETVACNKGDGGCIMNEMEDCRKTKEAISWSRWFNATLEKLRWFFFSLQKTCAETSLYGSGGWRSSTGSCLILCRNIEIVELHSQKCCSSAAVAENASSCVSDRKAVIFYKLLWDIKAWISQIALWKLSYFDLNVPMFPFLICKIRIIVLKLLAGDSICSPTFGKQFWAMVMCKKVQKFRRKWIILSLQHNLNTLKEVCPEHWTNSKTKCGVSASQCGGTHFTQSCVCCLRKGFHSSDQIIARENPQNTAGSHLLSLKLW